MTALAENIAIAFVLVQIILSVTYLVLNRMLERGSPKVANVIKAGKKFEPVGIPLDVSVASTPPIFLGLIYSETIFWMGAMSGLVMLVASLRFRELWNTAGQALRA